MGNQQYWLMNSFDIHINMVPYMGGSRGGAGGPDSPAKSKVAIGFLRNTGTDPLKKQFGPSGPFASRESCIWPSVKYFF